MISRFSRLVLSILVVWTDVVTAIDINVGLNNLGRSPMITPKAQLWPRALGPRQGQVQTCGYFFGDAAEPLTCDPGLACASNTISYVFGCCSTNTAGFIIPSACVALVHPYTSCYDYSDASSCTGACADNNRVCESTSQYCAIAYSYTDTDVYTLRYCQTEPGTPVVKLFATATTTFTSSSRSAASSSTSDSQSFTGTTARSTISVSSTTSSSISTTASVASTTTPNAQSASTTPPTPQPDHNNTGAIAGGVVGGVLGLALIIGGAIFFLRRAKKQELRHSVAEVSQI